MNKKYITLFENLARATAVSAETVMDYNHEQGDTKGFETAKIMRDDYQALTDKIAELQENYKMNRSDAARLCVGAMIIVNQLQDKIESLKKALTGYQTDIIPKLQEIVDNTTTDDEVAEKAEATFVLDDNK